VELTRALIAGAIQGFTEFLPISSSGHLAVYYHLTGEAENAGLSFSVLLHCATLLAVAVVFRKDIYALVRAFFSIIKDVVKGKPDFEPPERRLLLMLIIGTVPAVIVGAGVKILHLDDYFTNIYIAASLLAVTAVLMFLTDRLKEGADTASTAPYKTALLAGALQSAAILPGLSRSGATIFGGRLGGLTKEFAVKFAFLLSIPAILGAAVIEGASVVKNGFGGMEPAAWAVGFVTAFVCGMLSIGAIKSIAKHNRFFVFGIYCLLASAFAFAVGLGLIAS